MHTVSYNDQMQQEHQCPMCGSEIDQNGDCTKDAPHEGLHEVVSGIMRMFLHNRSMMVAVAVKMECPEYSTRQIAEATGFSKSMVNYYLRDATRIIPHLKNVLTADTPSTRSQRDRRSKEVCGCSVTPEDMNNVTQTYLKHLQEAMKQKGKATT